MGPANVGTSPIGGLRQRAVPLVHGPPVCPSNIFANVTTRLFRISSRANGIRNTGHPVPDLAADGPWLECRCGFVCLQTQRRRVFVCRRGGEVIVSDRVGAEIRLPLGRDDDASDAVARLMLWSRQGVKIRSRALVTTLWARLCSTLFLHGIGGAKYDQVTDRLIEMILRATTAGHHGPLGDVVSARAAAAESGRATGHDSSRIRDLNVSPRN